ncbi:glycosyltransferase family 4 protein [Dyadobacter luticola]|uniref:Glycosyltransferase family 4 protein n=1 Tax=Dyadobacter luticola TaxID=1979387 RepID=A0A5R9KQ28_9BACT|nr:glycosyltransferase family 4 protein [Dyadobacter luticola]TLU98196.1 glycosyltransferase family 4 protein [Dyadobacter luticola]
MAKILILGKTPPPIGGITNHVKRLVENLPKSGFHDFTFCDLGKVNAQINLANILKHKNIHLHISRPGLQCLFAIFCKMSRKRLIITYHGNWGRYDWLGNLLVNLSAWLAYIPVVQNEASLKKALCWNRRAVNISTHLPSPPLKKPDMLLAKILKEFRKKYNLVLCSNAWNLTFEKNGKETYGISDLINRIKNEADIGLIISDPSRNYQKFIIEKSGSIPENVIFITEPYDFRHILTFSDAFIRNTTTDGVSLSIHEAWELNVPVLASEAVPRPTFCEVFKDIQEIDFEMSINRAKKLLKSGNPEKAGKDVMENLVDLYTSMLSDERRM